ncbi:MAG: CBS domain-containing protein [Pseudomonadota bacterium]
MTQSVDVNDYMVKHPVLVAPDMELFEAIHWILENKLSGVTVIDDKKHPVGMLSELDCLRAILSGTYYGDAIGKTPIKEIMTPSVECVTAHADLIDVAQSMLDHKHRRRPVVNGRNEVIGQLTCRQILRVIKNMGVPGKP